MKKSCILAVALSFLLGSVEAGAVTKKGNLKDPSDGKNYKTVQIGSQTWMAENLNYKGWDSFCYNNKTSNCAKYGRLYTWNSAMYACPSGWHLPTVSEFRTLFESVGGTKDKKEIERWANVGKMLKSKSNWTDNGNGTDVFGFSALPSGFGNFDGSEFGDQGVLAPFWTSSSVQVDSDGNAITDPNGDAMSIVFFYENDYGFINSNGKSGAGAVRCLKD